MRGTADEFKEALKKAAASLEWYPPRDIIFSREQILWIIEWLPVIEEGDWPPDLKETGYTETPHVQKSRSHKAHFETAAQIFAEVSARLDRTGEAGETLVWEVQHGLTDYELLSPPAKRALNYISGWRRRKDSFSKWCYDQLHRRKTEKIRK